MKTNPSRRKPRICSWLPLRLNIHHLMANFQPPEMICVPYVSGKNLDMSVNPVLSD